MLKENIIRQLEADQNFFNKSTSVLSEEDSEFVPQEGTFSVAAQVAHTGMSVDWFIDGAFTDKGFDMDIAAHEKKVRAVKSLSQAREILAEAFRRAIEVVSGKTDEELLALLPEGPIMNGAPKIAIFSGITDHTAHHRGVLTVYARLLGKVAPMPY